MVGTPTGDGSPGLRQMQVDEFVRRLTVDERTQERRFAFFLGAGCSVSSGIPVAATLVRDHWLPRLLEVRAPKETDHEAWARRTIDYDQSNPAGSYGRLIDELFVTPNDRQREIESLCDGRSPAFGYAVLAQLVAHSHGRFNVVLTTNFDDLIADALYLFTDSRPLVIQHESLAAFIRPTRTRPLIVKLHGDHRLAPRNTALELAEIEAEIARHTAMVLNDRGLIFIGYGGNDRGIQRLLAELPQDALPFGAYWVHPQEPAGEIREWLMKRGGVWVKSGWFDEVMLLARNAFDLPHPDSNRFTKIFADYQTAFQTLSTAIQERPATDAGTAALKEAVKETERSFPDYPVADFFSAVNQLLAGCEKLLRLRQQFPSLRFAVDNDVVMTVVAPSSRVSLPVRPLLQDESDFSAEDQATSLAERLGRFILYEMVRPGQGQLLSLPGHHGELWTRQAARIHRRLIEELSGSGLDSIAVQEQVRRFRDEFYEPVRQGAAVTAQQLIAAVPRQLRGWLGIGEATQEWHRLLHIQQRGLLSPLPPSLIGWSQLDPDATEEFRRDVKLARDKWEVRLVAAQEQWVKHARGGERPPTEYQLENIAEDALALAYWERLNRHTFRPPSARLMLITGSERIAVALSGVSAAELGGAPEEPAESYLLHPFDFLDECHLRLTGELAPTHGHDESGRFSTALRAMRESGIGGARLEMVREFREIWGRFLRACVLERVVRQSEQHSRHLKRVRFVFQRAGISADPSAANQLVVELAARGSEMLSGATDAWLRTIPLTSLTRGAPVLRLARHPYAQALQLQPAERYRDALTEPGAQAALIADAGGHRYTLHLHQARAFIWAGEWRTALTLCDFALAISDKVPGRSDGGVPDVDGREAMFLAAVCERHAGRGRRRALLAALNRLARFEEIAARGLQTSPQREAEFRLHTLRAQSERLAIHVTAALAVELRLFSDRELMMLRGLPPEGETSANRPSAVSGTVLEVPSPGDLLGALRWTRQEAAARGATSREAIVSLIYLLVEQQCWIQEAQYLLLMPASKTGVTMETLTDLIESASDLAARRATAAPDFNSPFRRIVQGVLTCVTGTATAEDRERLLHALDEQPPSGMVEFERRRRDEFMALVMAAS